MRRGRASAARAGGADPGPPGCDRVQSGCGYRVLDAPDQNGRVAISEAAQPDEPDPSSQGGPALRAACPERPTSALKRKDGGATMATLYAELPNKLISAANGIDYAYRETGEGSV